MMRPPGSATTTYMPPWLSATCAQPSSCSRLKQLEQHRLQRWWLQERVQGWWQPPCGEVPWQLQLHGEVEHRSSNGGGCRPRGGNHTGRWNMAVGHGGSTTAAVATPTSGPANTAARAATNKAAVAKPALSSSSALAVKPCSHHNHASCPEGHCKGQSASCSRKEGEAKAYRSRLKATKPLASSLLSLVADQLRSIDPCHTCPALGPRTQAPAPYSCTPLASIPLLSHCCFPHFTDHPPAALHNTVPTHTSIQTPILTHSSPQTTHSPIQTTPQHPCTPHTIYKNKTAF